MSNQISAGKAKGATKSLASVSLASSSNVASRDSNRFEYQRRWVRLADAKANSKCRPLFVVNPREQDARVERRAVCWYGAADRKDGDEVIRNR